MLPPVAFGLVQVVLSKTVEEATRLLNRTVTAVKIRRGQLRRKLAQEKGPRLLTLEEVKRIRRGKGVYPR